MDARMQKHRMRRWAGTSKALLLVFLATAILPARAAIESVPAVLLWCDGYTNICTYPTDIAAGKAGEASYNSLYMATNPYHGYIVVESCNGFGTCLYHFVNDLWTTATGPMYLRNAPACPIPAVEPTVPYRYDPFSKMCVREALCLAPNVLNLATGQCVPPQLSISIEPGETYLPTNGTFTVKPSTVLPLRAVVKDQNGVVQASKQVSLKVSVQTDTNGVPDGSGGHIHTANRPQGKFACQSALPAPTSATCTLTTDSNGQAPFFFLPTAVSGAHTITATCSGCGNTATAPVNVKVDNLIPIPGSSRYALSDSKGVIGAIPGKHIDNHYLTSTAITKLKGLADIYITVNPGAKLYLNDASLVWGGLFDVGKDTPWVSPHSLHDEGRSLDIRAANSGPNNEGSVPATVSREFIKQAQQKRFKIGLHCKNSTDTNYCLGQPNNRHFHVDF